MLPGWLYQSVSGLGERALRERAAAWCLQRAVNAEPASGQGLYLLGRCFAAQGKVHDAFIAYRNSVEKSEGNADTWCSIGWVSLICFPLLRKASGILFKIQTSIKILHINYNRSANILARKVEIMKNITHNHDI